jgi:uncharacterized protein YcaQ
MLTAQLLAGPRPTSVVQVVESLARLQIDPTNVIARAEHLVLWSRLGRYPVADLHRAAYTDRTLFEYWAYYLPTRDFPVHRETMRRWPVGDNYQTRRVRDFLAANVKFRRYVLAELRRRGPLRAREFEDRADAPWRTGGWNDGRNVGRMLDCLLMTGDIAVTDRHGRERVWDLASRCYALDQPRLPPREVARQLITTQLRARGVARPSHFGWEFGHARPPKFDEALADLVRAGTVVPVEVTGHNGPWYAHTAPLDAEFVGRTTLLCPFDRLIYNRELTEELFDFRYRMEMYVPRDKREFGYYVLPILDGDALVGRIDARIDRKARSLVVDAIFAEKGAPADAGSRIAAALTELATWQGAAEVSISRSVPRMWAKAMP